MGAYLMDDTSTDLFLGKVIHGYRLEQLLGRGALTSVYQACAEEKGAIPTLIATILLVPQTLPSQAKERFRERFFQTARQLEALRHPYICPCYGYGELDGHYYLLSPNTHGKTLLTYMAQKKSWSSQETLSLLLPIAEALEYLHSQGVVCQFFSPANVLLLDNEDDSQAPIQITGIGLLSMLRMKGLEVYDLAPYGYLKSVVGSYLGNPEYLAPEIVKGLEGGTSADVYSLGVLLFALLSGSSPFTGESYLEVAKKHVHEPLPSLHDRTPALPVSLELAINHALYRDPEYRFQYPHMLVTAYMHIVNERINVEHNLNIVRKIKQTYKMAAIEPRLLPPGAKRTVELRTVSGSFDAPAPEINEQKSENVVAESLEQASEIVPSPAEIPSDGTTPLEKTAKTPLLATFVFRMKKLGSRIRRVASKLAGLAARVTFPKILIHRYVLLSIKRFGNGIHIVASELVGLVSRVTFPKITMQWHLRVKKPIVEEKSDQVKDHSREKDGSEKKGNKEEENEEKGAKVVAALSEDGMQKRDVAPEAKEVESGKQIPAAAKENVIATQFAENSPAHGVIFFPPSLNPLPSRDSYQSQSSLDLLLGQSQRSSDSLANKDQPQPQGSLDPLSDRDQSQSQDSLYPLANKDQPQPQRSSDLLLGKDQSQPQKSLDYLSDRDQPQFQGSLTPLSGRDQLQRVRDSSQNNEIKDQINNNIVIAPLSPALAQPETTNKEIAQASPQNNSQPAASAPQITHNEQSLEDKRPEKQMLAKNKRVAFVGKTPVSEAHAEIITMMSQIQQLREQVQGQAKDHKPSRNGNARIHESEYGAKQEDFPEWLT